MSSLFSYQGRLWILFVLALLVPAIQFIPYGHDHENPPIVQEPSWDSNQTRELAKRACFDCHSNETQWLWYANVAPVSWLIAMDVSHGRRHLNFSDWRQGQREGEDVKKLRETIVEGEMPPLQYRLIHPEARLTKSQKRELIDGLVATAENSDGNPTSPPQ